MTVKAPNMTKNGWAARYSRKKVPDPFPWTLNTHGHFIPSGPDMEYTRNPDPRYSPWRKNLVPTNGGTWQRGRFGGYCPVQGGPPIVLGELQGGRFLSIDI